eukprot:3540535-Heterocapsa_arctica.AAC.1
MADPFKWNKHASVDEHHARVLALENLVRQQREHAAWLRSHTSRAAPEQYHPPTTVASSWAAPPANASGDIEASITRKRVIDPDPEPKPAYFGKEARSSSGLGDLHAVWNRRGLSERRNTDAG